jgi:hypothetical protein
MGLRGARNARWPNLKAHRQQPIRSLLVLVFLERPPVIRGMVAKRLRQQPALNADGLLRLGDDAFRFGVVLEDDAADDCVDGDRRAVGDQGDGVLDLN